MSTGGTTGMLGWGVGLVLLELSALTVWWSINPTAGLAVLSMIVACHLGGRLAFIGTGFAAGFSPLAIIGITSWHNAAMLMLIYPLFLRLAERVDRVPWMARLRDKVRLRQRLRSRWNLFGIAVFIWVPLPMSGCIVGALLAHLEGYEPKRVVPMALGAMFAGVVSWTLLFEPLYAWMKGIGPHVATVVTLVLILLPLLLNALRPRNSRPRVT